jgi:succinyl-diaminopimelate desuccinylase
VTRDLLALTADLVSVESVSRNESAIADLVEENLSSLNSLDVVRIENNIVARTSHGLPRRLILAGHLDTVPSHDGAVCRIDGDTLFGLGASDMKGGLAVMLDLAAEAGDPLVDVTYCFYACEEVDRSESGLLTLFEQAPELLEGDAAILGEPTDCLVEAGCQGTVRAVLHLGGVRAHAARPSTGVNAIHRLAPVLSRLAGYNGRRVEVDSCLYEEQLQAVAVSGGIAGNVVPDAVDLVINHRFAPDRSAREAVESLETMFHDQLLGDYDDSLTVDDVAEAARPSLDSPILQSLVALTGDAPRAKVGWTDVATFASHGVPATNFGPGDPLTAHRLGECVSRAALERARSILSTLVFG